MAMGVRIRETVSRWRSVRRLRAAERELRRTKGDVFDVPFVYTGHGAFESIRPKQVIPEIRALYELVRGADVRQVCEIGTFRGGTFYLWCQAARRDATLVAIDLPGDSSLSGAFSPARIEFYRHFARARSQQLYFVAADSHQPTTAERMAALLGGERLDFLFVDGDHAYSGVKRDFELYTPFVRRGGLIAFHDILPREEYPEMGVHRLWGELKQRYQRCQEFIATEGEYAGFVGIGVLWNE